MDYVGRNRIGIVDDESDRMNMRENPMSSRATRRRFVTKKNSRKSIGEGSIMFPSIMFRGITSPMDTIGNTDGCRRITRRGRSSRRINT